MNPEKERSLYQLVAIFCFFAAIFIGFKYSNLKTAYKKAEADKVHFCKEYKRVCRDLVGCENEVSKLNDVVIRISND